MLVLGAVLVLLSLVAAPKASAYQGSATAPGNIGSFESFLEQGSPMRVPGVDINDPRGTDWWAQEHQYFDRSQPSSNAMWSELAALEEDAGLIPRVATIAGDWVLPAAGAFLVGYQIGTGIREMFHIGEATTPGPSYASAFAGHAYGKGDQVLSSGTMDTTIFAPFRGVLIKYKVGAGGTCTVTPGSTTPQEGMSLCGYDQVFGCPALTSTLVTTDANAKVAWPNSDWSGVPQTMSTGGLLYYQTDPVVSPNTNCSNFGPVRPTLLSPTGVPIAWVPAHGPYLTCADSTKLFRVQPFFAPSPDDGDLEQGTCADAATQGSAGCITAPTTWPRKPADEQTLRQNIDQACDHHPKTCNAISNLIDGKSQQEAFGTDFPGAGTVVVPNCNGLLTQPCKANLETAGLNVVVNRLGWAGADVTRPGDAVVTTSPASGATVPRPSTVTITVNPLPENMPLVIPAPLPHETYQAYQARLAENGITDSQVALLPDPGYDPAFGPNEVTTVAPAPGHLYNPATPPTGEPSITANPPTAPPISGGGSCGTPGVRSFDLGPLAVGIGSVFPFGVFGWVGSTISSWVSSSSAPVWHFQLTEDITWDVDLDSLEPAMSVVRPCFLVLSALGIVWMLAAAAMKIQGPSEE